MKLIKDNIALETTEQGEIKSIKFLGQEILHDGKEWWQKTYPMIWPVIGFSEGWSVSGVDYTLPKHGFWKELKWESIYEGETITMLATHVADTRYPFTIDIQQNVAIEGNEVIIKTIFSNLGNEKAYFHFGHHPAFVIDDQSQIFIDNAEKPRAIDINGKLTKDTYELDILSKMDFGVKYDTLVWTDMNFKGMNFKANGLSISVSTDDFDSIQIWRPKDAKFICIEPWQGWCDRWYNSPKEAADKIEIVALESGEVKTFEVRIGIKK